MAFLLVALIAFILSIWTGSYVFAYGGLLLALVAYLIFGLGESSDLPGTAGKRNKDVPT